MTTKIQVKTLLVDLAELTKSRLVSLVLFSMSVGYVLGAKESFFWPQLVATMIGTFLIACGSMALNEWMERDLDALMKRTCKRPLPGKRMSAQEALAIGILLAGLGFSLLFFLINPLTAYLGLATLIIYLIIYTPMKRMTSLCTIVGAIPGAIPPLMGWSSATGKLSFEAWILFVILFLWQIPHFLALAWIYREDFERAGFKMLTMTDPSGEKVAAQTILYSVALLPVSLLPSLFGLTGVIYFWGSLAMGIGLIFLSLRCFKNFNAQAKPLFKYSILYLTLLFILMLIDKVKA